MHEQEALLPLGASFPVEISKAESPSGRWVCDLWNHVGGYGPRRSLACAPTLKLRFPVLAFKLEGLRTDSPTAPEATQPQNAQRCSGLAIVRISLLGVD